MYYVLKKFLEILLLLLLNSTNSKLDSLSRLVKTSDIARLNKNPTIFLQPFEILSVKINFLH